MNHPQGHTMVLSGGPAMSRDGFFRNPPPALPVLLLTSPLLPPSARTLWGALSRKISLSDPKAILAAVEVLIDQIDAAQRRIGNRAEVAGDLADRSRQEPQTAIGSTPLQRDVLVLTTAPSIEEDTFDHSDLDKKLLLSREP